MKKTFLIFLILSANLGFAQDIDYTRKMLETLTSGKYWGRGYTKNGMEKAANFIEAEFKKTGLETLGSGSYKQAFSFPVNTFPGKMHVNINGKELKPGEDFIVSPASSGVNAVVDLSKKDSATYVNEKYKVVVSLKDKLTWSVSTKEDSITTISVNRKRFKETPVRISAEIQNKFVPSFKAYNVSGIIKGTRFPDSMLVVTAHYDHLGGMGKGTFFPGANDNASGVAFLLSLAKHYIKNPPE
ncbi:MAG: M28 family peptidase, partial [Chitinophagaceae bacterium]